MCLTCDVLGNRVAPPGGTLLLTEHILVHHCLNVKVPGYLIVSPVRHVERVADLREDELSALWQTVKMAAEILGAVAGVEKVYIVSLGEETDHFHFHLFPRYQRMASLPAAEIRREGKIDGLRLLAYVRDHYRTSPETMSSPEMAAVINQIKQKLAPLAAGQRAASALPKTTAPLKTAPVTAAPLPGAVLFAALDQWEDCLRGSGWTYELITHELPAGNSAEVSAVLGILVGQTAPTQILKTDIGYIAVVAAGDRGRLSCARIAEKLGCRAVRLAKPEEVQAATGFAAGCVPPVGLTLPVILDERLRRYDFVYGGSGRADRTLKVDSHALNSLNKVIGILD